jgi:hypothetical protein
LRSETLAVEPSPLPGCIVTLYFEHVNRSVRKIVQSTGVIEVEVSEHDVPHVARVVAKPLHLAHGRHLRPEIRAHQR